ncbi:hypothetical protein FRC20_000311 [Serendipita sp. 405]|nr:hypothetical protein FRC16_000278 [Serendipita sp. 398]KAG8857272.1 hypothetical protein FRC20_000311 [Serendipita sp. 405]
MLFPSEVDSRRPRRPSAYLSQVGPLRNKWLYLSGDICPSYATFFCFAFNFSFSSFWKATMEISRRASLRHQKAEASWLLTGPYAHLAQSLPLRRRKHCAHCTRLPNLFY